MWPLIKNLITSKHAETDSIIESVEAKVVIVDTVVDLILAQIGIDNPSTADRTTLMNYLKVLDGLIGTASPGAGSTTNLFAYHKLIADRIGQASPVTADQTTVMNFLKQIKDTMPAAGLIGLGVSDTAIFSYVPESIGAANAATVIQKVTCPGNGMVRLKFTARNQNSTNTGSNGVHVHLRGIESQSSATTGAAQRVALAQPSSGASNQYSFDVPAVDGGVYVFTGLGSSASGYFYVSNISVCAVPSTVPSAILT